MLELNITKVTRVEIMKYIPDISSKSNFQSFILFITAILNYIFNFVDIVGIVKLYMSCYKF